MFSAQGNAVYRSLDEGATWDIASTLPLGAGSTIVAVLVTPTDPNVVLASGLGPGAGTGIYRSTDQGDNFTRVAVSQASTLFNDLFGRPIVYASAFECGCLDRSFDNGRSWARVQLSGLPGGARLALDPRNANKQWAATAAGVYHSTDHGFNWLTRFGFVRPTLSAPLVPFDFSLPPSSQGRLELPLRVLETNRWTLPLLVTTTGQPWLSVSEATSTPATPIVRVSTRDLTPGAYAATLRVTSAPAANSPFEVPVNLTVRAVEPEYGYTASTYAGVGQTGIFGDGGPAVRAAFGNPDSVAVDGAGAVFLSDPANSAVRSISPDGIIRRAAGNGQASFSGDGGEAVLAALRSPRGLAFDAAGNLYIADSDNTRIRRVTPNGFIFTLAERVPGVRGLAVDAAGNVYAAVPALHAVLRVAPSGALSLFAGVGLPGYRGDGGRAFLARLSSPHDVAVDRASGNVYIADTDNHVIRVVTPDGIIRTYAGNGNPGFQGDGEAATAVALARPQGICTDAAGNLYIADTDNQRIRAVEPGGRIRTIAGNGEPGFSGDSGPALAAQLRNPVDVAVDGSGNVYVADNVNIRIRRAAAPVIPRAVSLAGPSVKVAPGGFFSIYGAGFTNAALSASSLPYPATLGGVTVVVNGRQARLSYVSPTQINGQLPARTEPGAARFRMILSGASGPELPLDVAPSAPAILTFGQNRAVAQNPDGQVNTADNPAPPEAILTVYLTGIGLTDTAVDDGQAAPADPLARPVLPVRATVGGKPAEVLFLGLAPGYVALAQANLKPAALEPGDHPVVITVGEASSNAPVISVAPAAAAP
jgi:uncharacterized protein (TIGR03437 family)